MYILAEALAEHYGGQVSIKQQDNPINLQWFAAYSYTYGKIKDYKTYTQKPLLLFDGDSTICGLNFFAQNRSIVTNDLVFVPVEQTTNSVKMRLYAGNERYIEYV